MKILEVSSFFYPSVGGVERQVEEIAVKLADRNNQVTVFTTNATHGRDVRMQRLDERLNKVEIKRFSYLIKFGHFFRFSPGLAMNLFTKDYDLIHVHNFHDAHLPAAALACLFRRKKLVVTGHNPFVVSSEKRGARLHRLVGLYEKFLRVFTWRIDLYLALLESEKREVMSRFGWSDDKIAVIPNGIQDLFYQEDGRAFSFYEEWGINPKKWNLIVGTVSRMNYVKGIQNLRLAVNELPKVLFIFAGGDGGYLDELKRLYNLNQNVLFTDKYIASEKVKDFYQAIDIFLLPSVYEPFGMTVVEAMAQAKPVLATSAGGPSEIIPDDAGEIIAPTDLSRWKERIGYYQKHKQDLEAMGESARRAATVYRWENVIDAMEAAFTQLLRK